MRFRQRMGLLVATAVAALVLIMGASALMMGQADQALTRVQRSYVPLLELNRDLSSAALRIPQLLQHAVDARDPELLEEADALRDELLARLAADRRVLERNGRSPDLLERSFLDYYARAREISTDLMAGEITEEVVARIEAMAQAQVEFEALLSEATTPRREDVLRTFEEARAALRGVVLVNGLVALAVLALLGGLSVWIVRAAVRSLEEISQGVERLAAGDFATPIPVLGDDEFGELARKANITAGLLRKSHEELESFTYSVSHDLRAPLRAVDGFGRILGEEHAAELGDEGRRVLGVVLKNVAKMGRLIDDLLALSRVGRRELTFTPVDMGALAAEAAAEAREAEPERSIEVQIEPLPDATGDAALLEQVWLNLLRNAVKYTRPRERARIEVSGRVEDGEVRYAVKDNGVGYDERYADKLFRPFQRLHDESEFEGSGVGLALIHRIVDRHGGRVGSIGKPDAGATFWFTLPGRPSHG